MVDVALDRAILVEDAVYEFTQGYMGEIELQVVVGIKMHTEVVVSQRSGDYVLGGGGSATNPKKMDQLILFHSFG